MERQQCDPLQKFDVNNKTDFLKKRLLKPINTSNSNSQRDNLQQNVLLRNFRAPTSGSMIVSSMQASQSSMPITHNLVTHSIAPVKIHTNNSPYPLQLSTVHVPVQIPGSTSNINVPVQLSGPTSSVPLQIAPVSLPIQVSTTTTVPVQLPAGETINVPLQIPASQNIQLTSQLPSMPLLQNTSQSLHNSIFHVHMGSNSRSTNMESTSELTVTSSQSQMASESGVQMKINSSSSMSVSQVQVSSNQVVQIPSSSSNPIQLTLPGTGGGGGPVQLRGASRPVPHVVYIQTPTGLKPVTSTEVISQASTSGNPPQIIVRRPVTNNSNFHLIPNVNKPNIAPKIIGQNKSLLAPGNAGQPIVIQKPKSTDKMMVPISIAPGTQGKQTVAYLGPVKKAKSLSENQSILISNNQGNVSTNNQKLFITPMNMPKIQNTKFILPVTLPATMASKGPIINLQIANGQIQNDPQGNITVMRDTGDNADMPPLQPITKVHNGKETGSIPQSPKTDKPFSITLTGSRAEPTGEQGEYTLSIPETNASMNDDIFTVSIADDEDGQSEEKSFTLAIPEKGKSLLNRNLIERNETPSVTVAAPAILRRSNSDNTDKKANNANLKRRISLCTENMNNKTQKLNISPPKVCNKQNDPSDNNDDHRVPSLFCDEKMDKDLDVKVNLGESDGEDYKDAKTELYSKKSNVSIKKGQELRREPSLDDTPGLIWNNGVAMLRGSDLHFQTNEFGLIDVIEAGQVKQQFQTPLKQRITTISENKSGSPDDLYRCDGCGCHGMAAEFITPNYCSLTCQTDVQKILQKKREIERAALIRRKNKIKKLLMRKQLSESDIPADLRDDKELLKYLDETESSLSEAALMKLSSEDLVENEKYPWMCGKNGFSWMRYLDVCKAKAAPVKLFKDPFPYNRNGFKVGMRMEAIDPQNPALFCVVSVAEVQGYRMRLHFDEYPELYDYWVNADCPDLFPAGWCEKNGRALTPPASHVHAPASFSWPMYLKQQHAVAAPRHMFPHLTNTVFRSLKPNGFRIGMKLEAEDRKNELVCVATVADMLDHRMRISFDSWDEQYDCWVDPASPYIHPVGWAEENGVPLTPPNFIKDPASFTWEGYLAETGASAAPPRAFKTRPPYGFKPGMKLEVVDIRVPFLIRVASVSAVKGHQVLVSYDGWPDARAAWMDDDSPDVHPVGWCLKTGHPLEPPLTAEEAAVPGGCGVAGCRGLGSRRGGGHKQHAAAAACPLAAAPPPPPRLPPRAGPPAVPARISSSGKPKPVTSTPTSETTKPLRGRPPKHKRIEAVSKTEGSDDESVSSGGGGGSKRFRASPRPRERPVRREPTQIFDKYLSTLPSDPLQWTEEEVSGVVCGVAGAAAGAGAAAARLCGRALLLASCAELADALRLRLGPAVKLHALVRALRHRANTHAIHAHCS